MIKRKLLADLEKELSSDKIIVLTGMRRVGKTTLVNYLYEKLTEGRKLFLDLENPLNQTYFAETNYDNIMFIFERLAVGKGKKLTVFLDEIQNVKNLPSVAKYLRDRYRIKFVLTGSASFYLKNLFSESLVGRKRIFELYPFDFEEFLSGKGVSLAKPHVTETVSQSVFQLFEPYCSEYLHYGGFPSVVLQSSHEEKLKELDDIFTSYYQKEVLLLSDFRRLEIMKAAIALFLTRAGNKLDMSKISSELGITRVTISQYIDFLEGTYFLHRIRPFSRTMDVVLRGQPKVYVCDNGLFAKNLRVSEGAVLENAVFNLLRRREELFYYQSRGGAEIDFVVTGGQKTAAYEVKIKAQRSDVRRLAKTADKLGITEYYVVSLHYAPFPHVIYPFQL